jgi:diguanylate cyclase (GGDEF)-like protein
MSGLILLLAQALIYFGVMATLFRLRHLMGLGLFLCALGVMHFLETYLAAVFFIELPFGLISPGSTVLFSGKLAIILLLYIREDAETVRQPIYGLLVGNFLMVALVLTLRLYGPPAALPGYNPDLTLVDQLGMLMIWGTTLLFVDSLALILLYERLRKRIAATVPLISLISLAVILTFDQAAFFVVLHFVTGTPATALVGGWIAKMGAAVVYSVLIGFYLRVIERDPLDLPPQSLRDIFSTLTYRHRDEALSRRNGYDPVTGTLTGDLFQAMGQASLLRGLSSRAPVSIEVVAIDGFAELTTRHGRALADDTLRHVANQLQRTTRAGDRIFRHSEKAFIVLCENMGHEAALDHAARLSRAVAKAVAKAEAGTAESSALHVSIGVATYPDDAGNIIDLLQRAEAHLDDAQRLGPGHVAGNRGTASAPARTAQAPS